MTQRESMKIELLRASTSTQHTEFNGTRAILSSFRCITDSMLRLHWCVYQGAHALIRASIRARARSYNLTTASRQESNTFKPLILAVVRLNVALCSSLRVLNLHQIERNEATTTRKHYLHFLSKWFVTHAAELVFFSHQAYWVVVVVINFHHSIFSVWISLVSVRWVVWVRRRRTLICRLYVFARQNH